MTHHCKQVTNHKLEVLMTSSGVNQQHLAFWNRYNSLFTIYQQKILEMPHPTKLSCFLNFHSTAQAPFIPLQWLAIEDSSKAAALNSFMYLPIARTLRSAATHLVKHLHYQNCAVGPQEPMHLSTVQSQTNGVHIFLFLLNERSFPKPLCTMNSLIDKTF